MLKNAGIIVLGAAAGMGIFAPLASAGEAPASHRDDSGSHGHSKGWDRAEGGKSCDKFAGSNGDRLVSLDNVASNLDLHDVNLLASQTEIGGHCDGDKAAVSQGDRLISADNLLSNADVSDLNVLAKQNKINN